MNYVCWCHRDAFSTLAAGVDACIFLWSVAPSTANGKWGWCSSHEISHAARQNIQHVLFARYAAVTWRSFPVGEAINTKGLTVPLVSVCKWVHVSPEHGRIRRVCCDSLFSIRLDPTSSHARDDIVTHVFCHTHQSSKAPQILLRWMNFSLQSSARGHADSYLYI